MLLLSGLAIVLSLLCIIIFSPFSFSMLSSVFVSLHVGEFSGTLQTVNSALLGLLPGIGRGAVLRGVLKGIFLVCPSSISFVDSVCIFVSLFSQNLANLNQLRRIWDAGGGVDFSKLPLQGEKSTFITRVPSLCTTKDSRNWGSSKKKTMTSCTFICLSSMLYVSPS